MLTACALRLLPRPQRWACRQHPHPAGHRSGIVHRQACMVRPAQTHSWMLPPDTPPLHSPPAAPSARPCGAGGWLQALGHPTAANSMAAAAAAGEFGQGLSIEERTLIHQLLKLTISAGATAPTRLQGYKEGWTDTTSLNKLLAYWAEATARRPKWMADHDCNCSKALLAAGKN